MRKDFLLIVNPVAGKKKALKNLRVIEKFVEKSGFTYDIILTAKRGFATKIASENKGKFEHFIVLGGDGTLNEVVNGLNHNSEEILPKIGLFPLGSGNDFAKLLHTKNEITDISKRYFNKNYKIISSDWALAEIENQDGSRNEFKFINALGIGFDSFVAKVNLDTKFFSGLSSYVFAVLRSLFKYNGIVAEVKIGNKIFTKDKRLLLVTIGNNKTSGGGFYLNPFANISDGLLDVTTIEHLPILKILKNLPLTLVNKTENVKGFKNHKGKEITLELKEPFIVHADGEIFSDNAKKISIKLISKKLEIIA